MGQSAREKLVVIGNGMAGARVIEEILRRDPERFAITVFGAEPYGNYNRILLSHVLGGTQEPAETMLNSLAWYKEHGIELHAGVKVEAIDRDKRVVIGYPMEPGAAAYGTNGFDLEATPIVAEWDHLILATGSRPFVPPIPGRDKQGVFQFRTLDDCSRIVAWAGGSERAVVIGGGLLGLEAARGLLAHGLDVTVVEAAPWLMAAQLDEPGGAMLADAMAGMGVSVRVGTLTDEILGNGHVQGVRFGSGEEIAADMVVISAGIRPITEVATLANLKVERGIVCDDQMRTSDPRVFAVGECVEHRGKVYGLVEPIWEQARTLADILTGADTHAAYQGSKIATRLKVMGIDLASMGDARAESDDADLEIIRYSEPKAGIYQKLVLREGQLEGAILIGDVERAPLLERMFREGLPAPLRRSEMLQGSAGATPFSAADLPDDAQVCNCNGVSKGVILGAIAEGCASVARIAACTRAGSGCGSCKGLIGEILEASGAAQSDEREHWYVPGIPLRKPELVAAIQEQSLRSVSAVFAALGEGGEDAASKPGLASLLRSVWHDQYEDERDARFINDRVHANIQRDGTFSVIPRIYGGVTSPEELRRIADVAVKYEARMVKFTGGQRIDLLGIPKQHLPDVWRDLDMPSGHAYSKAFRTCKSCVGTDFCRYGLGASIELSQKIERRFQGIESPHKMKLATAGCPRNCSEAYVKDLGAVAIEGGSWEIYIGGAAGGTVRKGDLLCTVETHDEVLQMMGRFMQFYRENARYMERTYHLVERLGIVELCAILVEDRDGICARLDREIEAAVASSIDPWATDGERPAYPGQFEAPVSLADGKGAVA
ncbi:MAG: nitrite reductase large subunit NirB [Deltaproteobacteria bacterium]